MVSIHSSGDKAGEVPGDVRGIVAAAPGLPTSSHNASIDASASPTSSAPTTGLGTSADRCPVYRSIHSAIDITTAYELGAD